MAHLKFDEDLSLSEMSERLGISRQGCDDAIKRCVRALFSYEDRLGFKQKLARRKALVKQVIELVENMDGENWREHKGLALRALQEKMVEGETEDGV